VSQAFEFGVGWAGARPPDEYGELAVRVEELGFDVILVYGDLLFQPPALQLVVMAQSTDRIRLGLGCLNPFTLHPVEIAGQAAFLDQISDGRAFLGLVRGAWLGQLGIDQRRAPSAIRETAEIVARLLRGDTSGFTGKVFQLDKGLALNYPVLRSAVPTTIGTWSPKLGAIAGEIADELEIGGSANAKMIEIVRGHAEPGARLAGRSVDEIGIALNAVTVVDEDGDAARALARREGAPYVEVVAALDPTASADPEMLARMRTLLRRGEPERAGRLVSDELLAKFVIAGTPEEVVAQTVELASAGARRVDFGAPFGLSEARGLELLGNRVLPAVRDQLSR
jgi:5,10-methylenetetrahydromethanopterin reductase